MLKYLIILIFLFINKISAQVTQIVPLNSLRMNFSQNGAYLKDLDNKLPYYQGTWEGVSNNKKYSFIFIVSYQQLISLPNGDYYYEDRIIGKFKVIDLATNQVLYDDTTISNIDDYKINSSSTKGHLVLHFNDISAHCYNSALFILNKISGQPNQLQYYAFQYGYVSPIDCPYQNQEDIPMFLPQNDFVLTKQ